MWRPNFPRVRKFSFSLSKKHVKEAAHNYYHHSIHPEDEDDHPEKFQPWSYHDPESDPAHWYQCGYKIAAIGLEQSPINIQTCEVVTDELKNGGLEVLGVASCDSCDLMHVTHTVRGDWKNDAPHIKLDGKLYKLDQFHFHTPSEHAVDGSHFDMEMHLVHRNTENADELVVMGIFFKVGDQESDFLSQFLEDVPEEEGSCDGKNVSLEALVMNCPYWRYRGSLTTPPCTEGVNWILMQEIHPISAEQYEKYVHFFDEDTNRPVQPLHKRSVHCYR